MAVSQNGWTINPPLKTLVVSGVSFGGVHTGDAYIVLGYVAAFYHRNIEKLRDGQCGCYNPRLIPGTNVWSNHASATALDINWQLHVMGDRGTFTDAQERKIAELIDYCDGVIRWGGTFSNVDEMHFEIVKNATAVSALARKIEDEMTPEELLDYDNVPNLYSDKATNPNVTVRTALKAAVSVDVRTTDLQDRVDALEVQLGNVDLQTKTTGSAVSALASNVATLRTDVNGLKTQLDQVITLLTPPPPRRLVSPVPL